jgi:EmrB/QacA subfamily drug resistance transporter
VTGIWGRYTHQPERVVAILYSATMFVIFLDQTVVTVALPSISRTFHIAGASASQLIVVYLVSLAVFIPTAPWLGEVLGIKRTFLSALALFTLSSMLCGVAQTHAQLLAFRAVQGIGGGILVPTGLTMFVAAFPPARRAEIARVLAIPIACAPMTGPIIGGFFTTVLSWRWIFYINVPIGILALVVGVRMLPYDSPTADAHKFDLAGFLLAALACGLILLALSSGPSSGWLSVPVLAQGSVGALALVGFLRVERRNTQPLLDLTVFRGRLFRISNTTNLFVVATFQAILFLVPLFVQLAQGHSALTAGLTTCFEPMGALTFSQIVGRIYKRFGPRRLVGGALLVLVLILSLYQRLALDTDLWAMRGLMFCTGCCAVTVYISMQVATFAAVDDHQLGDATSVFTVTRQLGAALGVAVVASMLGFADAPAAGASPGPALLSSFHHGFLAAEVSTLIALILSARISDADAANTRMSLDPGGPAL